MIVLDASVVIAHLARSDPFHELATSLLVAAAQEQLAASAITLAEILAGPVRAGVLPAARRALDALRIDAVAIGADAPERLAHLRSTTRLKLPGCCVLLAAQDVRATTVLTFDVRLRAAATQAGYRTGP